MLLLQAPLLAYNHFVESVFVLNGFRDGLLGLASAGHAAQSEGHLSQGSALGPSFGLQGHDEATRAKRATIYRFPCCYWNIVMPYTL